MPIKTIIKPNTYFDSVTLKLISSQVSTMEGVNDVLMGMGTDRNKKTLTRLGLLTEEAKNSAPSDLLIGLWVADEAFLEGVSKKIEELIASLDKDNKKEIN